MKMYYQGSKKLLDPSEIPKNMHAFLPSQGCRSFPIAHGQYHLSKTLSRFLNGLQIKVTHCAVRLIDLLMLSEKFVVNRFHYQLGMNR